MSSQHNLIAIIPARGGSKRLPGKNLMNIAGKALICWTIETAIESGLFDKIYVNTDSEEIAKIAVESGAEVPFMRPDALAGDQVTTVAVLIDMVERLRRDHHSEATHLACLQPTSPLRTAKDIQQAVAMLHDQKADAIISLCKTEHSPLWSNTLPDNFSLQHFLPKDIQKTPSQKLPEYYRLNGAIYLCDINRMIAEQTLFLSSNVYAYIMSRKNSIDIDDQVDFDLAQIYLSSTR